MYRILQYKHTHIGIVSHAHTHTELQMWVTGPCSPSSVRKQVQSFYCREIAYALKPFRLDHCATLILPAKLVVT